jgi:hypothetical protein
VLRCVGMSASALSERGSRMGAAAEMSREKRQDHRQRMLLRDVQRVRSLGVKSQQEASR